MLSTITRNYFCLILTALLGATGTANGLGFSTGNQFSSQDISGRLQVQCMSGIPGGPTMGYTQCQLNILNPNEYAHFIGPTDVDADRVTLQATREDGSVSVEKTEGYDSKAGKSTGTFNLWIYTVFQRPLLGPGKNSVQFTLKKNNQVVRAGTFFATVGDGGSATCQRTGFFTSSSANDCASPQNFCGQYFSENNYCQ